MPIHTWDTELTNRTNRTSTAALYINVQLHMDVLSSRSRAKPLTNTSDKNKVGEDCIYSRLVNWLLTLLHMLYFGPYTYGLCSFSIYHFGLADLSYSEYIHKTPVIVIVIGL